MPEQQPYSEPLSPFVQSSLAALRATALAYEAMRRADSAIFETDRQMRLPDSQVYMYELDGMDALCVPGQPPENDLTRNLAGKFVVARNIFLPPPDAANYRHQHFHLYPYNATKRGGLARASARRTAMVALDTVALRSDRLMVRSVRQARRTIDPEQLVTADILFGIWLAQQADLA